MPAKYRYPLFAILSLTISVFAGDYFDRVKTSIFILESSYFFGDPSPGFFAISFIIRPLVAALINIIFHIVYSFIIKDKVISAIYRTTFTTLLTCAITFFYVYVEWIIIKGFWP
jgi:hypothetical protein